MNHKKYEGITLRVLAWTGEIYYPALVAYAKEFEAETGAEIQIEGFPWYWHLPWVPMGQLLQMLRALWDGVSSSLANRTPPKTALDIVAKRWTHLLEENPLDFEYQESWE